MLRPILAVVTGYLAIAAFVMVAFSAVWLALGASFAFRPGTVEVTAGWMLMAVPVNLAAAILGGLTCTWMSRSASGRPVQVLAGLVLALGILSAVLSLSADPPAPPPGTDLTTFAAAQYAVQPSWYEFTLPVIGVVGVLLGGVLGRRRSA